MLLSLTGYKDPLTAKFADGSNKKKLQNKSWIEKQNEVIMFVFVDDN